MTTLMPPLQSPAYALVNDLCESAALTSIHRSAPDEWAREDLLLANLEARGWGVCTTWATFTPPDGVNSPDKYCRPGR